MLTLARSAYLLLHFRHCYQLYPNRIMTISLYVLRKYTSKSHNNAVRCQKHPLHIKVLFCCRCCLLPLSWGKSRDWSPAARHCGSWSPSGRDDVTRPQRRRETLINDRWGSKCGFHRHFCVWQKLFPPLKPVCARLWLCFVTSVHVWDRWNSFWKSVRY